MKDRDDPDRFKFFATMRRAERERLSRFVGEERKRFILRCASGGGMQNADRRKQKISLPTFSWDQSK